MRPPTMTLADMAWTECLGWTIKEDFELAKGEVGIARSKITKLRGQHHQITLSLLPLAFMKGLHRRWGGGRFASLSVPEIRQLLDVVLPRLLRNL